MTYNFVFTAAVIAATLFTAALCMLSTQTSKRRSLVVVPIRATQSTHHRSQQASQM
jgi:hypothetical protein